MPTTAPAEYRTDDRAADIRYVVGATGSGKTWFTRNHCIAPHRGRTIIWDWKRDYPDITPVYDRVSDLAASVLRHKTVRFTPSFDAKECARQFDLVCRLAWTVARRTPEPLLFVAEELSEVTKASWAPPAWRRILVMGRAFNMTIVGTSQRPAFVDKTFTGNSNLVRCGRLAEELDAKAVAGRLGVRPTDLLALPDQHAYLLDGRGKVQYTQPK